jgi:hypothetical protein
MTVVTSIDMGILLQTLARSSYDARRHARRRRAQTNAYHEPDGVPALICRIATSTKIQANLLALTQLNGMMVAP